MPKRPCAEPGCKALVAFGRCPAHSRDAKRGTPAERGYDYDWQKFRAAFLAEFPFCLQCEREGRVTVADQVHHLESIEERPDLRLDRSNCEPLCAECHGRIGGKQRRRR